MFREVVLVGGEADFVAVQEFLANSKFRNLKTLTNADLDDLVRVLDSCTLFIGHDTGVSHLAAAVGAPTVVLFGPTNVRVWAPLGEHVSVITARDGRMESIRVEEVFTRIKSICELASNSEILREQELSGHKSPPASRREALRTGLKICDRCKLAR